MESLARSPRRVHGRPGASPARSTEIAAVDAGGVPAVWVSREGDPAPVILFFHGGGMVVGSSADHVEWLSRLLALTGGRALAIDFRLAPEHAWPAQVEDGVAAYGWLLDNGHRPVASRRSWASLAAPPPRRRPFSGCAIRGSRCRQAAFCSRRCSTSPPAPIARRQCRYRTPSSHANVSPDSSRSGAARPGSSGGLAAQRRSRGPAAAVGPGRQRRGDMRRRPPLRRAGMRGRCRGRVRSLAGHDPPLARIPRSARGSSRRPSGSPLSSRR